MTVRLSDEEKKFIEEETYIKNKLSLRLKAVRKTLGLTQQEVADELGISREVYTKWENGYWCPNLVGLTRFSAKYDVDFNYLFHGSFQSFRDGERVAKLVRMLQSLEK